MPVLTGVLVIILFCSIATNAIAQAQLNGYLKEHRVEGIRYRQMAYPSDFLKYGSYRCFFGFVFESQGDALRLILYLAAQVSSLSVRIWAIVWAISLIMNLLTPILAILALLRVI